jgi:hypothetical protein
MKQPDCVEYMYIGTGTSWTLWPSHVTITFGKLVKTDYRIYDEYYNNILKHDLMSINPIHNIFRKYLYK